MLEAQTVCVALSALLVAGQEPGGHGELAAIYCR